jgi:hypothetical protein
VHEALQPITDDFDGTKRALCVFTVHAWARGRRARLKASAGPIEPHAASRNVPENLTRDAAVVVPVAVDHARSAP